MLCPAVRIARLWGEDGPFVPHRVRHVDADENAVASSDVVVELARLGL